MKTIAVYLDQPEKRTVIKLGTRPGTPLSTCSDEELTSLLKTPTRRISKTEYEHLKALYTEEAPDD